MVLAMDRATLALEDGTILTGTPFGAAADAVFELVFNTSMTGYQEIITDPSYRGQGVLFTVSHIGNVGMNTEDYESLGPQVSAVVVRSLSPVVSNWRASRRTSSSRPASVPEAGEGGEDLSGWLAAHGVPGIGDVDTRALTRKLRDQGTLRAALSTQGAPPARLLEMARAWPGLDGRDMVREVTCAEPYPWTGDAADHWLSAVSHQPSGTSIVVYDFGTKRNILRHLAAHGARVTVVPAFTSCDETLARKPDGVVLSNGPGDPAGLPYAVETVRGLLRSGTPILGICLGHQLLGLALGGRTRRLKFGHHGANHPVKDLRTGRALITSQNHNYCVEAESLDPAVIVRDEAIPAEIEVTHLSLNDGSLEGMRLRDRPVLSVQFHPEASAGPHDAQNIFSEFFALMHYKSCPHDLTSTPL
jgi:carbamoyl-phosphate synthase small subunit